MSDNLQKWERMESKRSASEASHIDNLGLNATKSQVQRYLDPPLDTWHELEYCYALLGDVRDKTLTAFSRTFARIDSSCIYPDKCMALFAAEHQSA